MLEFAFLVPLAEWVVTHPWASAMPKVTVADLSGVEMLADVDHNVGQVIVRFSVPTTGTLTLIGVTGTTVSVTKPRIGHLVTASPGRTIGPRIGHLED